MISILIIEDHLLVRESIKDTLSVIPGYQVIGETDNIAEAYEKVVTLKPTIILADINIRGESSVSLIQKIGITIPHPKIIVISMNNEGAFIKKMFSVGVKGYVTKYSPKADLIEGIEKVANGEIYFCSEVKKLLIGETNKDIELSYKELEIIRLVSKGMGNKEIAVQLHISVKGVEAHKTKIYRKLKIRSNGELINYAISRGIG